MLGVRITSLIDTYLDHLVVERGLSGHTVQAYRRDLDRYADFLHTRSVTTADAVTPTMITDYAVSLREGVPGEAGWLRAPLAEASAARALVAVRSLHRFALDEGLITEDPARAVRPPRAARRLPKALGIDEVQRLLETPDPKTPDGMRDRALLELLYSTGGRISEILAIDVDDVARLVDRADEVDGLRVIGKGDKERIVPLGRFAKRAVVDYLVRARPQLVVRGSGTPALLVNARGARLSRQSAWNVLQTHAEHAQITADVSPHTLRHSFATHLLDGGADVRVVQELLGHASVTTTQIYTLVTVDHLREVYLTAHPRAR